MAIAWAGRVPLGAWPSEEVGTSSRFLVSERGRLYHRCGIKVDGGIQRHLENTPNIRVAVMVRAAGADMQRSSHHFGSSHR